MLESNIKKLKVFMNKPEVRCNGGQSFGKTKKSKLGGMPPNFDF